jgi:hypothetical protein
MIAATRGILAEGRTEMEGSFIREAWLASGIIQTATTASFAGRRGREGVGEGQSTTNVQVTEHPLKYYKYLSIG